MGPGVPRGCLHLQTCLVTALICLLLAFKSPNKGSSSSQSAHLPDHGGEGGDCVFWLVSLFTVKGKRGKGALRDFRIKVVFRVGCPVQSSSHLDQHGV